MQKLTDATIMTIKLSHGVRLIELYFIINDIDKAKCLKIINHELNTNYNVNHLNNWLAGRKRTPERIKNICRLSILTEMFGCDGALLNDILRS